MQRHIEEKNETSEINKQVNKIEYNYGLEPTLKKKLLTSNDIELVNNILNLCKTTLTHERNMSNFLYIIGVRISFGFTSSDDEVLSLLGNVVKGFNKFPKSEVEEFYNKISDTGCSIEECNSHFFNKISRPRFFKIGNQAFDRINQIIKSIEDVDLPTNSI